MSDMPLSLTRSATSRRHSLAVGLAALAGLRQAPLTASKKKGSCKKKARKQVERTCGRQFEPCVTAAAPVCDRSRDPVACQATIR
ncbi:MAG: hypothetical protein KC442_19965, partial [Thermomicrobiales bacterium]|nr:hypothetical protein [Thermomicrobiales bacterium]